MAAQPVTLSTTHVMYSMQYLQDGPITSAAIVLPSNAGELLRPGSQLPSGDLYVHP